MSSCQLKLTMTAGYLKYCMPSIFFCMEVRVRSWSTEPRSSHMLLCALALGYTQDFTYATMYASTELHPVAMLHPECLGFDKWNRVLISHQVKSLVIFILRFGNYVHSLSLGFLFAGVLVEELSLPLQAMRSHSCCVLCLSALLVFFFLTVLIKTWL